MSSTRAIGSARTEFPDLDLGHLTGEIKRLRSDMAALTVRLAEAERLADSDVLTPLLNRRAFMRELQRAISICRRYKSRAAVVFIDLNGFKSVNDRHGHAAGDAVLVAVAERLLGAVREGDVVGRLGGDEFAVLLQHADAPSAMAKGESLRAAIVTDMVRLKGADVQVEVAFGVREISAADTAEQALAEADAAMYLRKPGRDEGPAALR
jgi:diguanylate cyclase (GGDEF)-like protein